MTEIDADRLLCVAYLLFGAAVHMASRGGSTELGFVEYETFNLSLLVTRDSWSGTAYFGGNGP